ncbi:AraC family transcriptional regulator [Flavobacterium sp. MC2016-06]|uniref:helix-turn-helix domain-containing protein n=1 Tax=Flavobacterium sp. MC2016-06 TaxID=2676308 RepID=UPI0012BAC4D2|nr:AraC family transcriptional regulator [Flavobacterium sp. MC2016-06]MBU3859676.1 AraC family transcriptional regulator [Flavobacterium sp. MC2016-06]
MKKITYSGTLTPECLYEMAEGLDTKVVDDKIAYIPKELGSGNIYFTQITPDISGIFFDVTFDSPVKITRLGSDNEFFIFHYDLSEHVNLIKINNTDYQIGAFDQLDLAIMDNILESSFKPAVNERTIAIRLFVNKSILNDFIKKYTAKKETKQKKENGKPSFYHYGNIDSNSILLIQSIKNKPVSDLSFESLLKGISLKLLGNFFNKFYNTDLNKNNITEIENESIIKTKEYLQNNLNGPFPSVTFLAAMAGMSESKYKALFKKCFDTTPNNFFIVEKMRLGKELLESGEYYTITEILYELNYSKLSYFTSKYYEIFNRKPSEDFLKRRHEH